MELLSYVIYVVFWGGINPHSGVQ